MRAPQNSHSLRPIFSVLSLLVALTMSFAGCVMEDDYGEYDPLENAEERADTNVNELHNKVRGCLESVDYNELGYSYAEAGETYTHASGSALWQIATFISYYISFPAIEWKAWYERHMKAYITGGSDADQYLNWLASHLQERFASSPWHNYQKVCVVQCIASRIIEYEANLLAKFSDTDYAVAKGVGVCTEFSRIAKRLINDSASPDVNAWLGMSPGHAFVRVQFDGNGYSIEPQHDPELANTCRFYR